MLVIWELHCDASPTMHALLVLRGQEKQGHHGVGGGVAAVPEGTAAKYCTHLSGQGDRLELSEPAAPAPAPLAQDTGTRSR